MRLSWSPRGRFGWVLCGRFGQGASPSIAPPSSPLDALGVCGVVAVVCFWRWGCRLLGAVIQLFALLCLRGFFARGDWDTNKRRRLRKIGKQATVLLSVVLSAGLLLAGAGAGTGARGGGVSLAWADGVSEAQVALDEAESRMASISQEHEALEAQAADLQERINDTAARALEAQEAMLAGREALGKSAVYEYRGGSVSLMLDVLLSSTSFDELMRNISYLNSIMQYQADEIEAQKARVTEFETLLSQLNMQKSDYDAKTAELDQRQAEAAQVVETARAHLGDAQAEETARLAALEEQQAALAAQEEAASGSGGEAPSGDSGTSNREEVAPPSTPVAPDPDPKPPSNDDGSGWVSGAASAYGGATDPYVSNPCRTATGDICDDNSMGVAIPMSWSNYRSYYGRTVEISYNGMTVLATVNDCGGLLGGKRSLDLQPGVWKAFGFSSCSAWGVRTVSYRFL